MTQTIPAPSATHRRRRSMAALVAFGLAASAIGAVTAANFTDTESTPRNAFVAGTLDLTVSGISNTSAVFDNLAPGDTETRTVTLSNAGSLDLQYTGTASLDVTAGLNRDGSAGSGTQAGDTGDETTTGQPGGTLGEEFDRDAPGGENLPLDVTIKRGTTVLYTSALKESDGTVNLTPAGPRYLSALADKHTNLADGAPVTEELTITVHVPVEAGNAVQGSRAVLSMGFLGEQVQNRDNSVAPLPVLEDPAGVSSGSVAATRDRNGGLTGVTWSPPATGTPTKYNFGYRFSGQPSYTMVEVPATAQPRYDLPSGDYDLTITPVSGGVAGPTTTKSLQAAGAAPSSGTWDGVGADYVTISSYTEGSDISMWFQETADATGYRITYRESMQQTRAADGSNATPDDAPPGAWITYEFPTSGHEIADGNISVRPTGWNRNTIYDIYVTPLFGTAVGVAGQVNTEVEPYNCITPENPSGGNPYNGSCLL